MKSLVVKEISTQLDENGLELELGTNQIKSECEYITKKEITLKAVKVTIDKDTFKTAIGGTLSEDYYYFQKTGNQWDLYGGAENVDLADYGITLDGTTYEDDRVYVYCDTVNNVVTSTNYEQTLEIYRGASNEKFNYINISCEIPNVSFTVSSVQSGGSTINVLSNVLKKTENFFKSEYPTAKIIATTSGYYDTVTVSIIVAKVL